MIYIVLMTKDLDNRLISRCYRGNCGAGSGGRYLWNWEQKMFVIWLMNGSLGSNSDIFQEGLLCVFSTLICCTIIVCVLPKSKRLCYSHKFRKLGHYCSNHLNLSKTRSTVICYSSAGWAWDKFRRPRLGVTKNIIVTQYQRKHSLG